MSGVWPCLYCSTPNPPHSSAWDPGDPRQGWPQPGDSTELPQVPSCPRYLALTFYLPHFVRCVGAEHPALDRGPWGAPVQHLCLHLPAFLQLLHKRSVFTDGAEDGAELACRAAAREPALRRSQSHRFPGLSCSGTAGLRKGAQHTQALTTAGTSPAVRGDSTWSRVQAEGQDRAGAAAAP